MPLKTTRVPWILARLVEEFRGEPAFGEDVEVLDGPKLSGEFAPTTLIIGWTDDDHRGATSQRATPSGPRLNGNEQWSITCALISVEGSEDDAGNEAAPLARGRVEAALEVIENRLGSDLNLGSGGSIVASMGSHEWFQIPTTRGVECTCLFELVGKSLL